MVFMFLLLAGMSPLYAQITRPANGQNPDRELQRMGIQFYQNNAFAKSLEIFSELYDKDPTHTNYTYSYYCMLELHEYKAAEKISRKQGKRNPGHLRYRIDQGYVFIRMGEQEKAARIFEDVIQSLPANTHEIKQVANAFYLRGQLEFAIETFRVGKELMQGEYTFDIELATMYERNGNYRLMVETYLDHLEEYPEARTDVQNKLQSAMSRDIEDRLPDILHESLLIRYQEKPDEVYLNELLLWLSIQRKDFSFAFTQARSLDKRFREDGYRVLEVAELALMNKYYDAALESYEYILDKGKDAPLYLNGLIGFLETRFQQIANNYVMDEDALLELEAAYLEAIAEFGVHRETMQLLRDMAHLQAFYLDKETEAVENLKLAIAIPGPKSITRASCKIELADIYLFMDEVWEATLLYSQVEKAFKNDPTGHKAKLKNAKLTYYIGEFAWSKAQLDVLKAATSKLIANDALELSLHISDNMDSDSNYIGLSYYARADLLYYQNKLDYAILTMDSLIPLTAWHPLFDDILLRKSEIYIKQGRFMEADSLLQQILIEFSQDILADDALFRRAKLYEEVFVDMDTAMELYRKLLTQYPGSIYTIEARKRFRELRGDEI